MRVEIKVTLDVVPRVGPERSDEDYIRIRTGTDAVRAVLRAADAHRLEIASGDDDHDINLVEVTGVGD